MYLPTLLNIISDTGGAIDLFKKSVFHFINFSLLFIHVLFHWFLLLSLLLHSFYLLCSFFLADSGRRLNHCFKVINLLLTIAFTTSHKLTCFFFFNFHSKYRQIFHVISYFIMSYLEDCCLISKFEFSRYLSVTKFYALCDLETFKCTETLKITRHVVNLGECSMSTWMFILQCWEAFSINVNYIKLVDSVV